MERLRNCRGLCVVVVVVVEVSSRGITGSKQGRYTETEGSLLAGVAVVAVAVTVAVVG